MLGLLYRDFINLKASLKSIVLSSVVIMVIAWFFNYGTIVIIAMPVVLAFSITGSFQCDAALKWNRQCMILPVTSGNVVLARYLIFMIMMIIGTVISFVYGNLYMSITNSSQINNHFTLELGIVIALITPLLNASLFLPSIYYYKGEKLEMAALCCIILTFLIFGGGALIIKYTTISFQYTDLNMYIYVLLAISFILFIISYFLSKKIYEIKSME